jgi:CRISPR-associated protein Cas1
MTSSDEILWQSFEDWQNGQKRVGYLYGAQPLSLRGKTLTLGQPEAGQTIPLNELARLVVMGSPGFDLDLAYTLVKKGVTIEFFDWLGHPKASFLPAECDEPQLCWGAQEKFQSHLGERLALAGRLVWAKVKNCAEVLRRRNLSLASLTEISRRLESAPADLDSLRGLEGAAARQYFQALGALVAPLPFNGRQYRPAPDPVNLMLSFGYSLLRNRLGQALIAAGLNPRLGFYHVGRGRHWALASDLMEDLRFLVDRLVLRLVRQKRVNTDDFKMEEGNCGFQSHQVFRLFVDEFEKAMSSTQAAPVARPGFKIGDEICFNQWLDATARGYAAFISGGPALEPYYMR